MGLVVCRWPSDNKSHVDLTFLNISRRKQVYKNGKQITAESEKEAVRKFSVWKREMETRELKVNINKTKLLVMGRKPAVSFILVHTIS